VVDGYAWLLDPAAVSTTSTATGLDPLAARQLVRGLSQTLGQESLANLDAIHAIAKQFGIVTPYSSMIVLVNDQQREALKQAEASADRFDREVETGTEQLTTPHNPFNVAAVPEPEEWLLIGLGLMGLCLLLLRQRYQLRSGSPM
jgi:putative PEP-CTERM system integral membrane protein